MKITHFFFVIKIWENKISDTIPLKTILAICIIVMINQLNSLKSEVASIQSDVSSVESGVFSIKSQTSSIKGDVSSIESDVSSIKLKQ